MRTNNTRKIGPYVIAEEGALLISTIGPGSSPNEVIGAFSLIGMGDEARYWASCRRMADEASARVPESQASTLFDVLVAEESDEVRALREAAVNARAKERDAFFPLGAVAKAVAENGPIPDVIA